MMKFDENEFIAFCSELAKVATKYGVSHGTIITIIAEATRNREKALESEKRVEVVKESVRVPEPIYAPPTIPEEIVDIRMPEPIYAPPTRDEKVEYIRIPDEKRPTRR